MLQQQEDRGTDLGFCVMMAAQDTLSEARIMLMRHLYLQCHCLGP